MTTEELVRLIERDRGFTGGGVRTIGSLSSLAGTTRRTIEEAIQTARLEGTPIITDGGIRVAQSSQEAHALADWLDARMVTQRRTVNAIREAADRMAPEIAAEPAYVEVPLWDADECAAA
jgi:hypothetical protein